MDRFNFDIVLKFLLFTAVIVIASFLALFSVVLFASDISDEALNRWLSVLGGMGTAVVALVAIIAIFKGDKRTKDIIDLDKDRQRLKGKEWILDIDTCSFVGIPTIPQMTKEDLHKIEVEHKQNKVLRYASLVIKGVHLSSLAQESNLDNPVLEQLFKVHEFLSKLWYVINIKSGFDLPEEMFIDLQGETKQYIEKLKTLDTNKLDTEFISKSRDLALANLKLQSLVSNSISTLYS